MMTHDLHKRIVQRLVVVVETFPFGEYERIALTLPKDHIFLNGSGNKAPAVFFFK